MTAPTTRATPKIALDQRAASRHDNAPSIAAATMGGTTKASDNVMRIERSLLCSRAAMTSMV